MIVFQVNTPAELKDEIVKVLEFQRDTEESMASQEIRLKSKAIRESRASLCTYLINLLNQAEIQPR